MKKFRYKFTGEVVEFELDNADFYFSGRDKEGILIVLPREMMLKSLDWEEVKEPLFTTEDGVAIHDGEVYSLVRPGGISGRMTMFTYTAVADSPQLWRNTQHKLFSTREKAAEYVFFHTPCLSLADLFPNGPEKTAYYLKIFGIAKIKCNG